MRFNLLDGIRPMDRDGARRDTLAGVTLASMNIPQVLGYTRIAGMPVVTGLYTLLLPAVAFAVFGSSRHLVVAADSATAAIFAAGLSPLASPASPKYVALVCMVALLTGALLLVARALKLGFLADFFSRTVLVGFLTGVGVQVGIAVLPDMLGIPVATHRTVEQVRQIVRDAGATHLATLWLSAAVVFVILAGRHYFPRWPIPLFAVVAAIALSYLLDFAGGGMAIIGALPGGLPSLAFPVVTLTETLALLPVAASCFLVIVAQSDATSRAMALLRDERVDANADLLGLAAANLAAGVSGAFVVNGSPTQTAMGDRAGARSQLAQVVAAIAVVVVLLLLTKPLQYLPRGVLAGIVFTIAIGLIDVKQLDAIRRESPGEFTLALVTAAAVAFAGLEQGILLAVALSLLRHVSHSYRPHTAVLAPDDLGRWMPMPVAPGAQSEPGLVVYRFGADLFYANEARFVDEVRSLVRTAPVPVRWVVIEAGAITDVDYSAARSVRDLYEELKRTGVTMLFARVTPGLRSDMDRHGITAMVGGAHCFPSLHEAVRYAQDAMRPDVAQLEGRPPPTARGSAATGVNPDRG